MSRKDLFSTDSHGLRVLGPQENDISPTIIASNSDEFEGPPSGRERLPIMQACSGCHGRREGPGILSVRAFRNNFLIHPAFDMFGDSERQYLEIAAMSHKWETYSWGLLQGLLERESK